MKVQLSPRQRAAIFLRFFAVPDWGGDEDRIMLRAKIWKELNLEAFKKGADTLAPDKLSAKGQPWELTADMADHVIVSLVSQGTNFELGLTCAETIAELRKVFPRKKVEAPA